MRVCFCYNVKTALPSTDLSKQKDIEFDSPQVIEGIKKALISLGHSVIDVEADLDAYEKLKRLKGKIDIVFNIAEGLGGDARESQIPLFCEMLAIPYTHSTPTVHALGLDKEFTKMVVRGGDLCKVPASQVVTTADFSFDDSLKFPLIVKPNKEGSSKGVLDKNVVNNQEALKKVVGELVADIGGEVLIEEYINGREFTVSILGNNPPRILPIIEQRFDMLPEGMHHIASYELKWIYEDSLKNPADAYICPAKLDEPIKAEIEKTSLAIYEFLGVYDCARIDYRLDSQNRLYFLEINTLPGLNPDEEVISYFPLASRKAGLKFNQLIGLILDSACRRWGI